MAVYIDRYFARYRNMRMCHMMADTHHELMQMAHRLDLSPAWLQYSGQPREHFDICTSKRRQAITLGAIEVESRDLVQLIRKRRGEKFDPGCVTCRPPDAPT